MLSPFFLALKGSLTPSNFLGDLNNAPSHRAVASLVDPAPSAKPWVLVRRAESVAEGPEVLERTGFKVFGTHPDMNLRLLADNIKRHCHADTAIVFVVRPPIVGSSSSGTQSSLTPNIRGFPMLSRPTGTAETPERLELPVFYDVSLERLLQTSSNMKCTTVTRTKRSHNCGADDEDCRAPWVLTPASVLKWLRYDGLGDSLSTATPGAPRSGEVFNEYLCRYQS